MEAEQRLGNLILHILEDAREFAPIVPTIFEEAMRHCTEVRFPCCREWFLEEVSRIADGKASSKWNDMLKMQIIMAGSAQVPPDTPETMELWKKLLHIPYYSTLALRMLARGSSRETLDLLPVWWGIMGENPARTEELRAILMRAIRVGGQQDKFLQELHLKGKAWPMPLRMQVNEAIGPWARRPIFRPEPTATSL